MNGKIKTKFAALFAVALMITVCVVPMVGNDYGEATTETITVPSDGYITKDVTISGTVFFKTGTGMEGAKVTITPGSNSYFSPVEGYTESDGSYELTIQVIAEQDEFKYSAIVGIDISDTDFGEGENKYKNPAAGIWTSAPTLVITNATGDVSGMDFKAGNVAIQGQLYYKNGSDDLGKVTLSSSSTKVTLYETDGTTYKNMKNSTNNNIETTVGTNGSYTIYIPQGLEAKTEGYTLVLGYTFAGENEPTYVSVGTDKSSKVDIHSNTYVFLIESDAKYSDTLVIKGTGSYKVDTSVTINTGKRETYVQFTSEDGDNSITAIGKYGQIDFTNNNPSTSSVKTYTYEQTNKVYGTVSMDGVLSKASTGTSTPVILKFTDSEGESVSVTVKASAISEKGEFEVYYETPTDENKAKVSKVALVYSENEYEVSDFVFGEAKESNISMDSTGYSKLSGYVYNENSIGLKNVSVKIAGPAKSTFPELNNGEITVETDENGYYAIMVKTGNEVKITPDSNYQYDIASIDREINGATSQDFTMNSREITFAVGDAIADEPLEGAYISYSTDYVPGAEDDNSTWNVDALITDDEGFAKLVVDGNATVYAYATYDGRFFNNNSDEPVPVDNDAYIFQTSDVKYYVYFSDESEAVELTDDLPVVMYGKETVFEDSNDNSVGKAYDWEEKYALVPVGSEKGCAVFYAEMPESGYNYYLYDNDGMVGDYYAWKSIKTVTQPTLNNGIPDYHTTYSYFPLTKHTAYGSVVDSKGEGLSGVTVTLINEDEETIGSGITNSKGYFSFGATEDPTNAKIVVSDAGLYTFTNFELYGVYSYNVEVYADQGTYDGQAYDAESTPITGKKITVTVLDENGEVISTAVTDANGKFKVIASLYLNYQIKAEGDGFTFEDDTIYSEYNIEHLSAEQTIGTVKVKEYYTSNPIEGAEVSLYKVFNDKANELIGTGKTDKNGKVTILYIEDSASYDVYAFVKSVANGYTFDKDGYEMINSDLDITSNNKMIPVKLLPKNSSDSSIVGAGYKIESFNNDGIIYTKVGEAITDNNGEAKIISGATYKITGPEGAAFTFGNEGEEYTISFVANESIYTGTVKSKGDAGVAIEGVKITLKNADGEIVGAGVTDENGAYEIVADDATTAFAADAELAIGKFTFDENGVAFADSTANDGNYVANIAAEQFLYSGYYADGAVIKDVKVSYTDKDGAILSANVVDNKYYIASIDVVNGSVTATATNFYASGTVGQKLTYVEADVKKCDVVTSVNGLYAKVLGLNADSKAFYGTVLTLVAQNEYSEGVPGEDGVIQKYKFAGWYVNGEKVSDDLVTTYTVNGDCTIYADYKVSSYVAAPADESNGLSMDVLVLGIVIVVLGLLAFAYAVKFKKE